MAISSTSGLVSNIDYQSLISSLVSVQRQSITRLEDDKEKLQEQDTAYSTLKSKVEELKSAADALRTSSGFDVFKTSVSDETVLGATAGSSSLTGTYQIVVTTLAKAHKTAAAGVASSTSTVAAGAGLFNFQVGGGAVQSIAVDATTTLTSLKDSINALDAGVTATIVNDGSGATPYRLVLTSDSTGTANSITITQNDTSLVFADVQAAVDASFTVDGMTITKSSNTVTDVIDGVTLELKSEAPATTVTLGVTRDTDAISNKITAIIDKFNAVVGAIKGNNRYDSETKTAGAFFGDAVARGIWDDLRNVFGKEISGLPSTMNRLIHIGMSSSTDGVYSVDSSDLSSALSTSLDDVINLFVDGASTDGFAKLIYDKADEISNYADGRIKNRQDGIQSNISRLEDEIREKESDLVDYENSLRAQFTALEMMLAGLKNQGNFLSSMY